MTGSFTRRDVLAAFLGAPLALAACKKPKRIPDGEIAFRPDDLGHRVRDEAPPEIPEDKWQRAGVVIVGAGVAGLSAALRLREKGYDDFVLLELEGAAGGTARGGANATSAFPWGAHYITAPMRHNTDLLALLRSFDLLEPTVREKSGEPVFREEIMCREPQERVFAGGKWHEGLYLHEGETEAERADFSRFKEIIEKLADTRDARGRRAFAVPVATGSDDPEIAALDKTSMAEWLARQKLGSKRLAWLVDYACRDDFGARATQTSAWAGVHYYASRLLAAGAEPQPVLTWPAGNGWLVAKMAERVREKLKVGLAAIDVRPVTREGREIVEVVAVGRPPAVAAFRADRVVFAAPQMVARRVLRPYRDAPPPHLAAFEYGAWMVANVTLGARPKAKTPAERVMAWDNVLYDSPSLGYVCATHQTGRDHGPTVITYYHPLTDDDPRAGRKRLYAASREEWADVALTDLETAHPDIREIATRVDVVRWGHAMARPSPGFVFGTARLAAAKPHRNVHFAHTELSAVALFEEAFFHGTRAADEVLAAVRPA